MQRMPCSHVAVFTTARITALSAGASPPPVRIPILPNIRSSLSLPIANCRLPMTGVAYQQMEIDDDAKEIVREIGSAINESVENSTKVAEAIERLREAGYEMELTLRLEIGLRPHAGDDDSTTEAANLDLTEEDLQILQRMKIRIDPEGNQ